MEKTYFVTITGLNHYYGKKPFEIGRIIKLIKEPDNEYDKEKGEDKVTGAVTEDNGSNAVATTPEYETVGTCLAYCLENVVASNMQNKHLKI